MLELAGLHAYYGKSHILHGVDMRVGEGEIVSLLGRNGSGRSTTVKTIMGLVHGEGSIRLRNEEILGQRTFNIAHRGIGYVPENRDIFPKLTVEHDMGVVFGLADKIAVLVYGEVIAFDVPEAVRANTRVQEAYLGSVLAEHA